jgi:PAS domain S-box-containing protein
MLQTTMSEFPNLALGSRNQKNEISVLLQELIDASGSNIAILDDRQTILYVNRGWRQFACQTGLVEADYGVGLKYSGFQRGTTAASASDSAAIEMGISNVIRRREIEFQMEYRCTAVSDPVWFHIHAAAFRISDDGPSMVLVNHDNITHEKLASEILITDRERLRRLMATTNIIPWEADVADRTFTYIGERAAQVFGYSLGSWTRPDFWKNHLHPDDRTRTIEKCGLYSKNGDEYQLEYRMLTSRGDIVWINDIVGVHEESGIRKTRRGFMIDVTERKRSEDTLRLLSGRLIAAQEDERKRIARELHDDLNQRMALIAIELEQIGQTLGNKTGGSAERIKGLQKKVGEISSDIESMSYKLHPSKLEHLGLAPALRSFCSEVADSRGLCIDFISDEMPSAISGDITLCVFRVAQEALQNAVKHSGASQIVVILSKTNQAIELLVSDNGCGFEMNQREAGKGAWIHQHERTFKTSERKYRSAFETQARHRGQYFSTVERFAHFT